MKPHKHAEVIKAWADGATVQWEAHGSEQWVDETHPNWSNEFITWRIKPEQPEKVYPETGLSESQCAGAYIEGGVIAIANAALRHAIDSGQVFVNQEAGWTYARDARDMAIAEAVRNACGNYFGWSKFFGEIDLPAIIATVKD